MQLAHSRFSPTLHGKTAFHARRLFASCIAISLALSLLPTALHASGPSSNNLLNYQIRLKDSTGAVVPDGSYNLKLTLYTASSGGTQLYTYCATTDSPTGTPESFPVTFTGGVGTVIIGDTSITCNNSGFEQALPGTLFANTSIFLGLTVGADAEMTPRKRITASGYAINADKLDDLETSATGGTASFVPITDASGNLTLTGNPTGSAAVITANPAAAQVAADDLLLALRNNGTSVFTVDVEGDTVIGGVANINGTALTLDQDNAGAGANVRLIANQGSDNDGEIRYNATTNVWELSNDGGAFTAITTGTAGANTALSNLAAVAINTSLLPATDDTIDLGDNTHRWRDLYLGPGSLHVGTSTTDEGVISYDTTGNILNFGTDATTNADIAFFTDDLFLDKSTGFVGIGDATPAAMLTVGSGDLFQVDSSGNLIRLNSVAYTWPGANASGVLTNNGSGTLTWTASSGTSLQSAYDADADGSNATITTNSTDGDVVIAGDQDFRFTASGNVEFETDNVHSEGLKWTSRVDGVTDRSWQGMTYGNGIFVAVGSTSCASDCVMTSPDGINWTTRVPATNNNWRAVTYGNGLFVAVATSGTGDRIMTSPDGITWTTRTNPIDLNWESVAYGNGTFVAAGVPTGSGNGFMTSPDGITWTSRAAGTTTAATGVTYGNGKFVAVLSNGDARYSTDNGATWTTTDHALTNAWSSVAYGNGVFVAVANSNANRIMTSPDGITWTARTPPEDTTWQEVVFGDGLFVAVASTGTTRIMTSPDGITWTARTAPNTNAWQSVAYGNGVFAAVSTTGTDRVMTSGKTVLAPFSANNVYQGGMSVFGRLDLPAHTTGNGLNLPTNAGAPSAFAGSTAEGDIVWDSTNDALYLYDGSAFARVGGPATTTLQQTYDNDVNGSDALITTNSTDGDVVIAGTQDLRFTSTGTVEYATDEVHSKGVKWTARTGANTNTWNSITYGNGLFVAVASSGVGTRVQTSPDGINWTVRTSASDSAWNSITYGNGLFVAVGTSAIMTSPNGVTWTSRTSPEANNWQSVTYGNGKFVAVSSTGTNRSMSSDDGITWSVASTPSAGQWTTVTYGNGLYVAISGGSTDVITSTNGTSWSATTSPANGGWTSIVYGNGTFVVVGNSASNRAMTSTNGTSWTLQTASAMNTWNDVTYGDGLFVAVANSGTGDRVMTSPDGVTWTSRSSTADSQWWGVAYGNGVFAAVANSTTNIMTSGKIDAVPFSANNVYQGGLSVFGRLDLPAHTTGNGLNLPTNAGVPTAFAGSTAEGDIVWDSTNNALYVASDASTFTQIGGATGANTALSNLAAVAINTSLLPATDDTIDLGDNTHRWRDLYLGPGTLRIGTSTTDEGTVSYDTTNNILGFSTDSTSNADIAFFTDDLYLDKSTGRLGLSTTSPQATLNLGSTASALGSGSLLMDLGNIETPNGGFGVFENLIESNVIQFTVSNLTRGTVTDPYGNNVANSLTDDNNGGTTSEVTFTTTGTASTAYTFSVWMRNTSVAAADDITIAISDDGTVPATTTRTITGAELTSASYRRYSVTHTTASGTANVTVHIGHGTSNADAFNVMRAQLSTGSNPEVFVDRDDADVAVSGVGLSTVAAYVYGGLATIAGTSTGAQLYVRAPGSGVNADASVRFETNGGSWYLGRNTADESFSIGSSSTLSGNEFAMDTSGNVTLTQNLSVQGNTTLGNAATDTVTFTADIASNLIPSADDTYTLGDASNRWADLFLGPATLHVGTSATDEGTLSYDTTANVLGIATDSTTNGDIAFFTDDLYLDKSTGFAGFGTASPTATLDLTPAAASGASGTARGWLQVRSATYTDNATAASGTAPAFAFAGFQAPTLAATNTTVTTTNAATVYIAGAPAEGTNMSIVNPLSLWVDSGYSRFDGEVGIGKSPTAFTILDVEAEFDATVRFKGAGGYSHAFIESAGGATDDPYLAWQISGASFTAGIDNSDGDKFKISGGTGLGTNDRITVDSAGLVGIGTNAPAVKLHVADTSGDGITILRLEDSNSSCNFTADTGAPLCGSDRTLKKDISRITGSLDVVRALDPSYYRWKTDGSEVPLRAGFIAQEVEAVLPSMVKDGTWVDGTTRKFLAMGDMLPYAFGAIKELDARVSAMEDKVVSRLPSVDALEPGELAMLDTAGPGVKRALGGREEAPSYLLMGVVGEDVPADGKYPVITSGKATVRVVGPVKIGEPLTVSLTSGVAVVAESPTYVIGYAISEKTATGPGTVDVMVRIGWWNGPGTEEIEQGNTDLSGDLETGITGPVDYAAQVIVNVGSLEGTGGLWRIDTEGKLTATSIEADKVRTKQLEVTVDDESQLSGEAVILTGNSSVRVENPAVRANSRVFITFFGNVEGSWWISSRVDGSFEVTLSSLAPTDLRFEYFIVNLDDRRTPPAPEEPPIPVPQEPDEPETTPTDTPEPEDPIPPNPEPAPEATPAAEPEVAPEPETTQESQPEPVQTTTPTEETPPPTDQ